MADVCDHPAHSNPALIIPCPKCGQDWKYTMIAEPELARLRADLAYWERVANERLKRLQSREEQ